MQDKDAGFPTYTSAGLPFRYKIQDKDAGIPTYTSVGLPLTIILRCKNGRSRSLDLKDKKASTRGREKGLPQVRTRSPALVPGRVTREKKARDTHRIEL